MTNRKLANQIAAVASAIAMAAGGFAACGQDKAIQEPAPQNAATEAEESHESRGNASAKKTAPSQERSDNGKAGQPDAQETSDRGSGNAQAEAEREPDPKETRTGDTGKDAAQGTANPDQKEEASSASDSTKASGKDAAKTPAEQEKAPETPSASEPSSTTDSEEAYRQHEQDRQTAIYDQLLNGKNASEMSEVEVLEYSRLFHKLTKQYRLDPAHASVEQQAIMARADELLAEGYVLTEDGILRPDGTDAYAEPGEEASEAEAERARQRAVYEERLTSDMSAEEMNEVEVLEYSRLFNYISERFGLDRANAPEEQQAIMARADELLAEGYVLTEDGILRPDGTDAYASPADGSDEAHEHTWEEVTEVLHHEAEYETVHHAEEALIVHHDAEYETVHHEAEYEDVEHPAEYDMIHHDAETEEIEHPAEVETVHHEAGTETVHHDAEYETVHHEAEYETVHHDEVTEEVEHPAETETVHHEAEYETVHHEEETEPVHHEAEYEEVEHPAEVETVHHEAEAEDVEHPAEVEIIHHDAEVETVHHDAVYETVHHEAETEAVHHDAEYETLHHEAVYEVIHHEAEYEMVHHDAVEEERYVVDQAAWDEDVYEEVEVCADCGFTSKDGDILEHMLAGMENGTCSGSYYTENVVVDTIHHDEVGHTETVVVEEAWDEEVCTKEAYDEEVLTEEAYDEQVLIAEGWDEIVVTKEAYDEEVLTEEAYDEDVVVKEAWDETVENPGSAASEEAANTIEKDIYFIEHEYEGHLTMDDGSVGSVKLESSSKTQGTPKYEVVSGRSAVVSEDGVVTPRATTYYSAGNVWTTFKIDGAESYQDYTVGDTVIRAKYDDHEDLYTIHVGSYSERYTNRKCQEIADEICADQAKSKVDQAEAITKYVAENSSYSEKYQSAESMIIFGMGDCWASTNTIIRIAEMAGLEARTHNAMGQAGAGAGHLNALFRIDGKYYIADAGMSMPAPRYYSFYEEADGIDGNRKTGWMRQYDRFDEDAVVPDWVTTLRNTVSDINNQLYEDSVFGRNDRNLVKTVSIPDSVKDISNVAFDTCYSLTDINVSEGNRHYKSVDGSLYTKSGSTLLFVPTAKKIVTVAAGTQKIADYAFGISKAEKVVLPYGLKSIGEGAFYSAHVNEVTIPKSVTFIHDTAFEVYNARNFKLRVYEGTYAERFAKEHNIPYEIIEEKPETVTKTISAKRKVKDGYDETVVKKAAYDEQKLVKAAWDEEVVTKDAYDEQKVVKEAWIETVVTKPAYDETVVVKDAWKERVKVREAYDETIVTKPAYDEQVLVQDAWDEIVTTKPAWVETVVTTPAFDEQVLVKAAWDEQILVQDAWDEEIVVSEAYDEDVVVKDAWTETVVTKPAYDDVVLVSEAWTETVKTRDAFDEQVLIRDAWDEEFYVIPAWDEQVLVRDAWDEVIRTGYYCSSCGEETVTI